MFPKLYQRIGADMIKDMIENTRDVFISGHIDLTQAEFDEHYAPDIRKAARAGASFVVGDAGGCDSMAQMLLASLGADTTVYHMLDKPRNNFGNHPARGGFISDEDRDRTMTNYTRRDIAWVRPGRENSGTGRNLVRRKSQATKIS